MRALACDGSAHGERYSSGPVGAAKGAGYRARSKRITSRRYGKAGRFTVWRTFGLYAEIVTMPPMRDLRRRSVRVGVRLPLQLQEMQEARGRYEFSDGFRM